MLRREHGPSESRPCRLDNRLRVGLKGTIRSGKTNEVNTHDFYTYDPNDHNWSCPELNKPSNVGKYLGSNFSNALNEADDDGIYVGPNDIWILMDLFDKYGYGDGGTMANDYTDDVYLGRALSFEGTYAVSEPNEVVKKVVKHNLGHCADVDHEAGNYQYNSDNQIDDVSPMTWGYLQVDTGPNCNTSYDSCVGGSDKIPDSFNYCDNPKDNKIDCNTSSGYACDCRNKCHHKFTFSKCTREDFEEAVNNRT